MTDELKACPFCPPSYEGKPEIRSNGIGDYYVYCGDGLETGCGASTSDRCCEGREQAARRWNTRPIEDALAARIAELEKVREAAEELLPHLGQPFGSPDGLTLYEQAVEKVRAAFAARRKEGS